MLLIKHFKNLSIYCCSNYATLMYILIMIGKVIYQTSNYEQAVSIYFHTSLILVTAHLQFTTSKQHGSSKYKVNVITAQNNIMYLP